MIGTVLNNRYRIDTELGQGGMGTVYRAHDSVLNRDVAVKVLNRTGLGSEGHARLLHEARAVAQLNHPNIVTVYDAGQDGDSLFIVMELVEGESLHDQAPRDIDEIVSVAKHLCMALEHAHEQGIIHRDLKPENVIVAADGSVKLMDFGLARSVASRMTSEGTIVGTVYYLAPELALGQAIDARTDLYALGIMLYELTTGKLPFMADDPIAVISQHVHAPIVSPRAHNEQIPLTLDTLIVRLLSKQADDRPRSAAEVLSTLKRLDEAQADDTKQSELSMLDRIVRGRLVGRERELAEATARWQRAAEGEGQVLLISGDPGIGKTRLVRELSTRVEVSGGKVLSGECYAEGGAPYAPIAQIIRSAFSNGLEQKLSDQIMADMLVIAPDLRAQYPNIQANAELDPESEQQRLFESVVALCNALTDTKALLLFIDDVHWADSGTLSMLRYLARRMRDRRLMIAATYREVDLDEARPFHEMMLDLNRERLATRIKLTHLNSEQTRALLAAMFAEEITPDFLEGIYHETEGNPFFIEEVCKALVESGKLYYADGHWNRPSMEELEMPQSVRVAIQSRVGKLSRQEQSTLQIAAVLGREFKYDVLRTVSELDEDSLVAVLENAERAQLIDEVRSTKTGATRATQLAFTFTHALIHSTLLTNLSTLRRQRLQRRVALALEHAYPDQLLELAPLLGRYFAEAGEGHKAVPYLLQAGDAARNLYAYREASEAYEQALLFLRERDDSEVAARTLMKLGLTYHNAFEFDKARQAYEEGFASWQRASETPMQPLAEIPPAPHAFRLLDSIDPPTLDPTHVHDTLSATMVQQLFSGLLELNADGALLPDVAQSWEILDGGRRYVFHLREDVRWSDDTPLTARDFEFAWKRSLQPTTSPTLSSMLYDIKGARSFHQGETRDRDAVAVQATDELTLSIELEAPTSYFLHILANSATMPVPQHVVQLHGEAWTDVANIVSNGPFTLKVRKRAESMTLERNVKYHGRFGGNLKQIEISISSEVDALASVQDLKMYESDNLDVLVLVGRLAAEQERARYRHINELVSGPALNVSYLRFDTSRPPFDDLRVRRAFAFATNQATIADVSLKGYAFPATGGYVPPGMAGHSPQIGLAYNPQQARDLLRQAGYAEHFPSIDTLAHSGDADMADALQTQWQENLGIEVTWRTTTFEKLIYGRGKERPHISIAGWSADYPDPDNFLRVSVSQLKEAGGWHNQTYERLVEDARRLTNHAERMNMYQQADRILIDDAAVIPLTYHRVHLLLKPWVRKYPISAINGAFWKDVIIEPH